MVGKLVEWLEEAVKGKLEADKSVSPPPRRKTIGVDQVQWAAKYLFTDPNFRVEAYVSDVDDGYVVRVYHPASKLVGKVFVDYMSLVVDPADAMRQMVDKVQRLQDDIAAEALWPDKL